MTRPRIYRDPDIDISTDNDNDSDKETYNVVVVRRLVSPVRTYVVRANNREDAIGGAELLAENDTRPWTNQHTVFEAIYCTAGDWAPADS
jgi:hypothetical protein